MNKKRLAKIRHAWEPKSISEAGRSEQRMVAELLAHIDAQAKRIRELAAVGRRDMQRVVDAHPLSSEFETDARDVWPERWAALVADGGPTQGDTKTERPWETTEACAEALREQLAARAEDAERIKELEAANARVRMPGYLWQRVVRLHRWLRRQRNYGFAARRTIEKMFAQMARDDAWRDVLDRRAAMADELATALRRASKVLHYELTMWERHGICEQVDGALARHDATKEPGPYMGLSPSSAATQHHPLKEDPNG